MAYQKLQVGRALSVIPSDDAEIPFPNQKTSGSNTLVGPNQLVDFGNDFIAASIEVGDVVYNTTTSTAATVVQVINTTTLILSADIFLASPDNYIIYKGGDNNGCVVYVGGGGDLEVTTVGGDRVILIGLLTGQFVPVQVVKVWAAGTSATNLLALW